MRRFTKTLVAGGILAVLAMGMPLATAQAQPWKDAGSKLTGRSYGGAPAYRGGGGGDRGYRSYKYAPAQPQVTRSFSYAPAPAYKAGDEVVVTAGRANLMIGNRAVGAASAGQHLRVLQVEGHWVGAQIEANGKQIGGWIRSELVTLAPATVR
ncbi:MAG: hypothetical protein HY000_20150 [Planctomycetes bacterium]|nr:hypothetical protein [Planctomycetota bacterium]